MLRVLTCFSQKILCDVNNCAVFMISRIQILSFSGRDFFVFGYVINRILKNLSGIKIAFTY